MARGRPQTAGSAYDTEGFVLDLYSLMSEIGRVVFSIIVLWMDFKRYGGGKNPISTKTNPSPQEMALNSRDIFLRIKT